MFMYVLAVTEGRKGQFCGESSVAKKQQHLRSLPKQPMLSAAYLEFFMVAVTPIQAFQGDVTNIAAAAHFPSTSRAEE
jgi:hypothetical protein